MKSKFAFFREIEIYLSFVSTLREFTKTNGRPVIKHEDILPVSIPYQRYKVQ